jgi:hypothetical protein
MMKTPPSTKRNIIKEPENCLSPILFILQNPSWRSLEMTKRTLPPSVIGMRRRNLTVTILRLGYLHKNTLSRPKVECVLRAYTP